MDYWSVSLQIYVYLFLYFPSLHKSLSQEENLKDQFNHTLSTYEEALKSRENIVSITQQQNEELAAQLQQALTDRANTEAELQRAMEASQAARDKVQKWVKWPCIISKACNKPKQNHSFDNETIHCLLCIC